MIKRDFYYLGGRFFDGISSGLVMMALPWFILSEPNRGPFVAMVALTCTVSTFLLTPFIAAWIDRYSRKRILMVNQAIQAIVAFVIVAAYLAGVGNHWLLGFSQVIYWVTMNMAWHANNAFTQENWQPGEYSQISGKQEVVAQFTLLGAGALGVVLLETWGIVHFALVAAFASVISTLAYHCTPYIRKSRQTNTQSTLSQIKESKTIFLSDSTFFVFIVCSQIAYPMLTFLGQLVPIWFAEQGVSGDWFAMYNMAVGAGALLAGLIISQLLKRFPHFSILQLAIFTLAMLLFAMSVGVPPALFIVLAALLGFAKAINRITRINVMHHHVDNRVRGRAEGGLAMIISVIQSLSYILIAFLSSIGKTELGFVIAGAVMLTSFGMLMVLGSVLKSRQRVTGATQ